MTRNRLSKTITFLLVASMVTSMIPMGDVSLKINAAERETIITEDEFLDGQRNKDDENDIQEDSVIEEIITGEERESNPSSREERVGLASGEREVYSSSVFGNTDNIIGTCSINEAEKTATMITCYHNRKNVDNSVMVPRTLIVSNLNGEEGEERVYDFTEGGEVSENGFLKSDPEKYIGTRYTVDSIDEDCFDGDISKQIIYIPNTIVTDITVDFFEDCEELKHIEIDRRPDETTYGRYYDGKNMDNSTTGERSFGVLIDLNNNAHTGDKTVVYCPPKYAYDNYVMKHEYSEGFIIGERAFQNCVNLKKVISYDNTYVKKIGKQAFLNCPKLEKAQVFDTTLESVGDEAFKGCVSLRTVKINKKTNGGQTLGKFVFQDTIMDSLNLSESVSMLSGATFYGMNRLESITVDSKNRHFVAKDGILFSYDARAEEHIGNRMVVFPSANTDALEDNTYEIPTSITEFDDYALYDCQNLKTLKFPSSIYAVGTHTMSDNRALRNVYIYSGFPDLQPDVSDDTNVTGNFENIFGPNITQAEKNNFKIFCGRNTRAWRFAVDCGYHPVAIYDEADYTHTSDGHGGRVLTGFRYTGEFTDIVIPNFVVTDSTTRPTTKEFYTTVSSGVLANPYITSVRFSVSMANIDPNAFRIVPDEDDYRKDTNADLLQNIYIEGGNHKIASIDGVLYRMAYDPRSQSYYMEQLLYYPVGRTDVAYRTVSSLSYLPQNAFRGAYHLKIVEIYDTIQSIGHISDLESNETAAFAGCKNLVAIDIIPNGVEDDDDFIRYGSDKGVLYGVDQGVMNRLLYYPKGERIPGDTGHSSGTYQVVSGCQVIHDVRNCIYLKEIKIPHSVTGIDDDAFAGSTELKAVEFEDPVRDSTSDGIQTIGKRAFMNTKITNLTLPTSIRSVGEEAFTQCSRLTSVTIMADHNLNVGEKAFYRDRSIQTVKIYGTKSTARGGDVTIGKDAFQNCSGIKTLEITNLTSLALLDRAFAYNSALETIDFLQTNVSTIGQEAFRGNTSLTRLDLYDSDGLSVIGEGAFRDCSSLNDATLPTHLVTISDGAFENCHRLIELNFDDLTNLDTIGNRAFRNCGFTVIPLKRGVRSLGDCAFQACNLLTSMYIPDTVTAITGNPFQGYGRTLLIYGQSGSYIDQYITYRLVGTKPTFVAGSLPSTIVNIDKPSITIYDVGITEEQLTAITQNPENASVIWKSMDPDIATVDANTGLVKSGTKTGSTLIRAICTTNGAYATSSVEVVETKVVIPYESIVLNKNGNNRSKYLNASSVPLRAITYKSGSGRVATVNKKGRVTARGLGTTTITAMAGSKEKGTYREATVNVTVVKASLKLDHTKLVLNNKGDEENLTAELSATHQGAEEEVVWKSSNPRVVAIPAPDKKTGLTTGDTIKITALRSGKAKITATCNGIKRSCTVTVKPVTTKLNYTTLTMYVGGSNVDTKKLKAKTTGINKKVEWASDHDEYAYVDEKGVVTALSRGTAIITATCNGVPATCIVHVLDSEVTIKSAEDSEYDISKGIFMNSKGDNRYHLNAKVVGKSPKVKWTSTAKDVVTVNSKGVLEGKSYGEAEIIATANGVDSSCNVTVLDTRTELDAKRLVIHLKSDALTSQTLTVNIEGADYTRSLEWASSNPDVVEIERCDSNANNNATKFTGSGTAYITARKAGKARIYVEANGVLEECLVIVKND